MELPLAERHARTQTIDRPALHRQAAGVRTRPDRFLFVLEQSLGNITHSRNLERSIAQDRTIAATIERVAPRAHRSWHERVPLMASWSFQASWAARQAVHRHLLQGSIDALFVHTQVASLLLGSVMASIPTIVSLDATPANFDTVGAGYHHRRGARPVEAVKRAINRRAFTAAAGLVAFSRWAADSLIEDYAVPPEKVRVIPAAIDLGLFRPAAGRREPGPVRVLFVGGDFQRKGGDELLASMARVCDRAELDIVTTSSVSPPAGIRCRVHKGLAPNSEALVALYRQADIFALPTRSDCYSFAIIEAMACGLPVIATGAGGIADLVHDGINGVVIPAQAPEKLASALELLVEQPGLRRAMGQAGLTAARRDHDIVRYGEAILDLMRSVAARV